MMTTSTSKKFVRNYKPIMQKVFTLFAFFIFGITQLKAQVAVTVTGNTNTTPALAATYTNLATAITALNTVTAFSGPVTLTCAAGTETAPSGGYSISFTGTTSSTNNVTIVGSGVTITAPSPAGTAGALNDALIKIIGSDWVTIQGFTLNENVTNTTTATATNNMVEWGIALLYATTTNGAQNCTLQNNIITLNRTYSNSFGIYANATHSATAVTTSATATGTAGGNSGLKVYSNTISNVNQGIIIVGPTAVADMNTGIDVGGSSIATGNSITNMGSALAATSYANVSGTINGILVRNSLGFNVSYNTITVPTGNIAAATGTLNGIQIPAASTTTTAPSTHTNNILSNTISLNSAGTGLNIVGISSPSSTTLNTTGTINIIGNTLSNFSFTNAAPTGTTTFITMTGTYLRAYIGNNIANFASNTCSSTGSITFISHSNTMPANAIDSVYNNTLTGFTKSGAGGTITGFTSGASSPNSAHCFIVNNSVGNINTSNATASTTSYIGISNSDGNLSSPVKIFKNNNFSNVNLGINTGTVTGISVSYIQGAGTSINTGYPTSSEISGNNLSNYSTTGTQVTGINIGSTYGNTTGSVNVFNNSINNYTTNSTTGAVTGINCANSNPNINIYGHSLFTFSSVGSGSVVGISITGGTSTNVYKNKIYGLSGTNASTTVYGLNITAGTTVTAHNNLIGNLNATNANAANPLNGINITGGTTSNIYNNTVNINATSTGALFGSSAINASTTPTVNLRNNIFVNTSTPNGTGISAAYRRSTTTLTTYASTSNNNLFYADAPSANRVIFYDGTTVQQTLTAFKTLVANRDSISISENPNFLSIVGSNAQFLHIDSTIPTGINAGAAVLAGITDDYDGQLRDISTPDIGADEFILSVLTCSSASGGTASPATSTRCQGQTLSMSTTGHTTGAGITYQWEVSTTGGGVGFNNVTGGTGATTASYATGALTPGTYYYRLNVTCSTGPVTGYSNEIVVTVNPTPTVSISASSSSYCTPGGAAASLTASGANTYAWSPTAGLSASTGSPVNASPSANTTYTVIGTDANGCTASSTSTIVVGANPILSSITATPSNICNGSTSQLNIVAGINGATNTYNFSPSSGTFTPLSGGTVVSAIKADDAVSGVLPIGFSFMYAGNTYTNIYASSNGFLSFNSAISSTASNNLTAPSTSIIPLIAPLWDDLDGSTAGTASYLTTGTVGNRVFTFEWLNWEWNYQANAAVISFQVKLYEANGKIEFVYNQNAAAYNAGTTGGASIGLVGTTVGNYLSLNNTSSTPTAVASPGTETSNLTTKPASGQVYTFNLPSATNFSWNPSTGLTPSSTVANPTTPNLTSSETYVVTVTNGSCSLQSTVSVTVGSPINCGILSTGGLNNCSGTQTVNVTASGGGAPYSYSWTEDGNSIGGNTASISTNAGTHVYEVTVTDACGQTCTTDLSVFTEETPVVSASSNSPVCVGQNIILTGTTSIPTATITWTGPSSYTSSSLSPTITGAALSNAGTYSLIATSNGCSSSPATTTVVVNSNPVITATATPTSIYTGNSSNLNATTPALTYCTSSHTSGCGSGDNMNVVTLNTMSASTQACGVTTGGTANYLIDLVNTTSLLAGSSHNLTVSFGADGTQYFGAWIDYNQDGTLSSSEFLGASGNAGSNGSTSISFTVPTGAFNGTTRLRVAGGNDSPLSAGQACGASSSVWGETRDYNITITGGTDLISYVWNPGSLSGSSQTVSPTTNTTYTVTATNSFGCTAQSTASVSLLFSIAETHTNVLCFGSNDGAITATTSNGTAPVTYTINPNIGNQYTAGEFTQLTAGTYTITATDASSNISTTVVTLTQPTDITSSVTLFSPTCNGGSNGMAVVTATGGTPYSSPTPYNYLFDWYDASTNTHLVNDDTLSNIGAGTYYLVTEDENACTDTIYNITLTEPAILTGTTNANTCNNQLPYVWLGNNYTATGTYLDTILASNGCDSFVTLNLVVNNANTGSSSDTACDLGVFGGVMYTSSGSHSVTYTNAAGCDSVHTYNVTINYTSTTSSNHTACNTLTIGGQTYTASGFHEVIYTNTAGCDSFHTYNVTINYSNTGSSSHTACNSGTFGGVTYTASGSHTVTYTNTAGCDSVHTYNVTINYSSTPTVLNVSGPSPFTLPWGTVVTASGTYTNMYSNANGCDSLITVNLTVVGVKLCAKVFLSGPYNTATGLMNDGLRSLNIVPVSDPYSIAPYNTVFTHVNSGPTATTTSSVLSVTGNDAIVDWIFIQLRDKNDDKVVLATRSALVQRDGDVVDVDGVSPVSFNIAPDQYFVSIKHRNHTGIMTLNKYALNNTPLCIDFTTTATPLYTRPAPSNNPAPLTGPTRMFGTVRALYAGNCNIDLTGNAFRFISYNALSTSDRTSLYNAAGASGTISGYSIFDVDMNGTARFNGLYPDRLVIYQNCAGSNTVNVNEQTPN